PMPACLWWRPIRTVRTRRSIARSLPACATSCAADRRRAPRRRSSSRRKGIAGGANGGGRLILRPHAQQVRQRFRQEVEVGALALAREQPPPRGVEVEQQFAL